MRANTETQNSKKAWQDRCSYNFIYTGGVMATHMGRGLTPNNQRGAVQNATRKRQGNSLMNCGLFGFFAEKLSNKPDQNFIYINNGGVMKKADLIRELKLDLKELEKSKIVDNIDYHRGKMDMLKKIIKDIQRPTKGRILPSQAGSGIKIARNYPEGHFNT